MISVSRKDAAEISHLLEIVCRRFDSLIKKKVYTISTFERNRVNEINLLKKRQNISEEQATESFEKAIQMYKNEVIELQQAKNKANDYINVMKFGSLDDTVIPRVDLIF